MNGLTRNLYDAVWEEFGIDGEEIMINSEIINHFKCYFEPEAKRLKKWIKENYNLLFKTIILTSDNHPLTHVLIVGTESECAKMTKKELKPLYFEELKKIF